MQLTRRNLARLAGGFAVCAAAAPALAEPLTIRMIGQHPAFLKQHPNVAIPAYNLNFVTSQQATAVASIGARTRLAMVLVGPDEATMRRLANEAYADLRARFEAAGVPVIAPDATRAMVRAAGVEEVPGNIERAAIAPGITIGKSLRRGWTSVGPDAAPMLSAFRTMSSQNGLMAVGFGKGGAFNKPGWELGATMIMPSLTIDFVNMSASTGSGLLGGARASVGGDVAFTVLSASPVTVQQPAQRGLGTPGGFRPREDVVSRTPFATVEKGGAAVRVGSMTETVDENYQSVQRARGDAVVVDMPVWEGLVRDAYRAYNAAIVAEVVKAKKK